MARKLPTITDENLLLVEFIDKQADELGRRSFFAYWLADNVGPALNERGTRGQVFSTNVDQWVAERERAGKRVEFIQTEQETA